MRRAAKVDDNHKQITDGLRAAGCFVQSMAAIGNGCVDLLVASRGFWHVLEVKDGDKCQSRRKLTQAEVWWIVNVRNIAPVHVVETLEQALEAVRGQRAA